MIPFFQSRPALADYTGLSDTALRERWERCRTALPPKENAPFPQPLLHELLSVAREAAHRTLGLRAYDVQIEAAAVLIQGRIAEMETGEGKTLAAALAAACLALHGRGVHVATVNRYLARRDAAFLEPFFTRLGLSLGLAEEGAAVEAKRAAYAAAITYGTGYEFGFDYLRDQLRLASRPAERTGERLRGRLLGRAAAAPAAPASWEPVQRALFFALIDEADGVLIDEALTPLIITPGGDGPHPQAALFREADRVAAALDPEYFEVESSARNATLTAAGLAHVYAIRRGTARTAALPRAWHLCVEQALRARHCLQRDVDYLVRGERIEIVDEYTGRSFADRRWPEGLHQAVEAKEALPVTPEGVAEVAISRQAFYRLYPRLAGMTGTARESAAEFSAVYRLAVKPIPRHRPSRLRLLPDRLFRSWADKLEAMTAEIARRYAAGQPVLVGTQSVLKSEELAARLAASGLPFRLLNARQDAAEAEAIGAAGEVGRITIATNMAGRGADIRLGPGAAERGGLFVLGQERHEAARVDRQLAGRAGRQGDPGEAQFFLSSDDSLLQLHGKAEAARLRRMSGGELPASAAGLFRRVQKRVEARLAAERRELTRREARLSSLKKHFISE